VPYRRKKIAYNAEGCLFFIRLRKAIGYKELIQKHMGFDGDSINSNGQGFADQKLLGNGVG
jgi:hypothetical protein